MTDRPASEKAFRKALTVLPGGVDSPVRAFQAVGGTPVFFVRGQGSRVEDADSRQYIDYCQSWGALLFGHAPETVVKKAVRQAAKGSTFGAPTKLETDLALAIRDFFPSMEKLRFVSSGTEAVMSALRLARGFTGRSLVLKFDGNYHGHSDPLLVNAGSGLATFSGQELASSAGVPAALARLTLSVPYNDLQAVEAAFAAHTGQIAAVIVEPVAANMGLVLPGPGFLRGLRDLCDRFGALLIFDEVITGFRVGSGGAQGLFGVKPDLTTLGKIVGGGYPAAAYGGRADIMALLAPGGPVYQAGTLSGNPVAMAAGLETLALIRKKPPYQRLDRLGQIFKEEVLGGPHPLDTDTYCLNTFAGMFTLFCTPGPVTTYAQAKKSDTALFARVYHNLLDAGIYTGPAQFEANFISAAHSLKEVAKTAQLLKTAAFKAQAAGSQP